MQTGALERRARFVLRLAGAAPLRAMTRSVAHRPRRELADRRHASRSAAAPRPKRVVVVAELTDGRHRGRGECVPYARYGETVDGVIGALAAMPDALARGPRPRGAAAGDAAPAPRATRSTARSGISKPSAPAGRRMRSPACPPRSRSSPPTRSRSARRERWRRPRAAAAARTLLKVKLGGAGDPERIAAVRRGGAAAPS